MLGGAGELPSPLPSRPTLPGTEGGEFPAEGTPDVGRARLYLSLPPEAPPGRYEGTASLGKVELPVTADVESEPGLDVEPGNVRFTARAGDRVDLDFIFFNSGNVPVEVRGAYIFGLFPDEGAERAILQSHTSEAEGAERLNVFVDALADEFAGTVRLKVNEGAGMLERGQGRDLHVTLTMPKGLDPGRSYDGTWEFEGASCYVRVDVPPTRIE